MGLQLRVAMPDQPGALARITQAIAQVGVDVMSVSVLESDGGRAIDDIRLRWPDGRSTTELVSVVSGLRGVDLLGCRRTRWLLDGRPELDLLTYLIAVPERGIETLVDMAPTVLDADWAELRAPAKRFPALHLSGPTAHDHRAPAAMPVRACAFLDERGSWAHLPMPSLHSVLVIGREEGPAFLRAELAHAERVLELATRTIARLREPSAVSASA
ncbi:MAG: ACT domain-containing protein [Frankiaceae bacterium]|nr:ACT domain-containing protein [Frankiaceae bacterium]MBV9870695.1 ACT domain-containing protein [Frankiaceae bacterium]